MRRHRLGTWHEPKSFLSSSIATVLIYSAVVVVTYINALVVRVFLLIEKNIYGQVSSDKNYLQKKKIKVNTMLKKRGVIQSSFIHLLGRDAGNCPIFSMSK